MTNAAKHIMSNTLLVQEDNDTQRFSLLIGPNNVVQFAFCRTRHHFTQFKKGVVNRSIVGKQRVKIGASQNTNIVWI